MTEDKTGEAEGETGAKGICNKADYFLAIGVFGAEVHAGITLIESVIFVTATALDLVVGIGANVDFTVFEIGVTPFKSKLNSDQQKVVAADLKQKLSDINTKLSNVAAAVNDTTTDIERVGTVGVGLQTKVEEQTTAISNFKSALTAEVIAMSTADVVATKTETVLDAFDTVALHSETTAAKNVVQGIVSTVQTTVSKIVATRTKAVTTANEQIASHCEQYLQLFK